MKSSFAVELLLAGSAAAVLHIPVVKRDRHTNGQTNDVARLVRRAGTLETTIYSGVGFVSGGAYYLNITAGTPPQPQTVLLDTGSSDLYLDASSSSACESSGPHSCKGGTYDKSSSSTYNEVDASPAFNASYGDGSEAIGPYGSDVVCISDYCIEGVQFGLAEELKTTVGPSTGLMGVGDTDIEATRQLYPNIPSTLVDAGIINSRVYSLYLNDYGDITGSILFGGIDTDKYTGTLQTTDTLPDPVTRYVDQFITAVTACKTNVGGTSSSIWSDGNTGAAAYKSNPSLPVLLDSGSSAWSVPQDYYNSIVNEFSYVDASNGVASCSNRYSGDSITLTFNGAVDVTIDVREFLLPLYDPTTNEPETLQNGDQACAFEIVASPGTGEGFDTMGDAILRSMYIVYDLDQGTLSIAQANLNSTSSNIKEVQAGPNGVASAAGSTGATAAPQSYSVWPKLSSTAFTYTTDGTTLGTATGLNAVPTAARVTGEVGGSGSGSSSSGGSGSSGSSGSGGHKSDASALVPASIVWSALCTFVGAAVMACFMM